MSNQTLYRIIRDRAEWTRLTTERVLDGWFRDIDCTEPATEREADECGDDIYTDAGWNTEPTQYPVLASMTWSDDEGCPVDDPDCLGRAEDCHDACERPAGD